MVRVRIGHGRTPVLDLQISDTVVIVVLLLLFGGVADVVPIVVRLLKP